MPLITRERVTRRLLEAGSGVTLIAARPGLGKSVAFRQLCESSTDPVLHYETRADAFVPFVRGLVDAAARIAPGLQTSFPGAIEFAMQSSRPHDEVAIWMLDHLKAAKVRVVAVEDLHRATADARVGRLLVRLVSDSAQSIRWVFAARDRQTLPLEALRATGAQIVELGEDHLRLQRDEAWQLAQCTAFPHEHFSTLFEVTRGVPAAFHFGLFAFDAQELPSADAYEFYANRYLDGCPADLLEMLLGLCVLDEVDDELLERSPWASCAHYVHSLADEGLMFLRRDGDRYRLHEPLRALLLERLGSSISRRQAQRSCGLMLEDRGAIERALELYIRCGDVTSTRRLCESHGFQLIDQGHIDLLRRALASLEKTDVQSSAPLLALRGLCESLAGRSDTAESWYLHALRMAEHTELRATIAHRYALDLIRQGRPEGVTILEPYAAHSWLPPELAAHLHSTLATAYVVAKRFDDARVAIERARTFMAASDSVSLHAAIEHQISWVALFTGDIPPARRHASRAVELALSCSLYDIAARAYSVLLNITYELEDDMRAALKVLNAIWDCGLKAGDVRLRLYALTGSFDAAAELGDTDALERMGRSLDAHEVDYADPLISETLLPGQALRLAAAGDFLEAFRLLAPTAERQITDDRCALRFAEIALYAAAAGRMGEARSAVARALERVEHLDPNLRRALRANAMIAVALYVIGRRGDARERLNKLTSSQHHASLRIRTLIQALKVLFDRWDGSENFDRLLDVLETLRTSDFGGIAAVLSALPYQLPVNAA